MNGYVKTALWGAFFFWFETLPRRVRHNIFMIVSGIVTTLLMMLMYFSYDSDLRIAQRKLRLDAEAECYTLAATKYEGPADSTRDRAFIASCMKSKGF